MTPQFRPAAFWLPDARQIEHVGVLAERSARLLFASLVVGAGVFEVITEVVAGGVVAVAVAVGAGANDHILKVVRDLLEVRARGNGSVCVGLSG